MNSKIPFSKYQGLGNDFILIDNRGRQELPFTPDQVKFWCDRHFGIGADGIIYLGQSGQEYTMRIINSDGSECEMCGNGIRCLAQFMADLGIPTTGKDQYFIHTLAGLIVPQFQDGRITVDMGEPRLLCGQIPATLGTADAKIIGVPLKVHDREWSVTLVSMGNPHCVVFVADIDQVPYTTIGPLFEHHPAFPKESIRNLCRC
jgi:diaminopimelate epimerase